MLLWLLQSIKDTNVSSDQSSAYFTTTSIPNIYDKPYLFFFLLSPFVSKTLVS